MSRHTPGPWGVEDYTTISGGREYDVVSSLGRRVAAGLVQADAHIIAAAPELLEALEELWSICLSCAPAIIPDPHMDKAALAIDKARGES